MFMCFKISINKSLAILITLLLTFPVSIFYCQDYSKIVRLSGKISNPNSDKIFIRGKDFKKVIKVSSEGEFSDTLKVEPGDYSFYDTKESTSIYLEPGYDLHITIDTKDFDETIKYVGIGERPNNFLASYFMFKEKNAIGNNEYKKMSSQEYFDYSIMTFEKSLALLNQSKIDNESFAYKQNETFTYQLLTDLIGSKVGKEYFSNNSTAIITQYLDKKINSINFKDELLFQSNYSLRFFNSYFTVGLVANDINCLNKYENDINEQQKKGIISSLKRGISFYNEEEMDAYYLTLKKLLGDDNSFQKIKTKYEQINSLKKGNPSPTFNYPDSSGKSVSLASLLGKLVYVDVWATWCGPCKAQIPYLKELEEKYRTKEVAFVSISIDQLKDSTKWKKMIVDKELKGIQIMADNAWRSTFVKDYIIEGIPRFILIDQSGNILSPNAPRPASYNEGSYALNDEIQKLLDENL